MVILTPIVGAQPDSVLPIAFLEKLKNRTNCAEDKSTKPFCNQNSSATVPKLQGQNSLFNESESWEFLSNGAMFLILFSGILIGIIKGISRCGNHGVNTQRVFG